MTNLSTMSLAPRSSIPGNVPSVVKRLANAQHAMSTEFPIVAFLQNAWFPDGTNPAIIRQYLTDQKFRRIILSRTMSGKRLVRAFDYRFSQIWWDNASEYVANTSPGKAEADPLHMERILSKIKPRAVLCFGEIATQGMQAVWELQKEDTAAELHFLIDIFREGHWHCFPHPNARGITQYQLNAFAAEVISRYF
jgi:hypothetical protein